MPGIEGTDGHRDILQVFCALLRGDDDLGQPFSRLSTLSISTTICVYTAEAKTTAKYAKEVAAKSRDTIGLCI